jgi:chromatin remodeling complex protein RSC6
MPRKAVQKLKSNEPVLSDPVVSDVEETKPETEMKRRYVPTRETVENEFDDLINVIDNEVSRLREVTSKSVGVKFLRTLGKKVKTLKVHTLRVTRQKKNVTRKNTNSGFLKPVHISKELAKFAGWDPSELKSRLCVTRYLCKYIKDHNLQNPEDRRQIRVEDDSKLRKLLKFDSKKDKKPLTYYSLQTYLKDHYPTVEPVAV